MVKRPNWLRRRHLLPKAFMRGRFLPNAANEEEVRQKVIEILVQSYGYPRHLLGTEVPVRFGSNRTASRADVALLAEKPGEGESISNDDILVIVETKSPGEFSDDGREQLKSYLRATAARYGALTDGVRTEVLHKTPEQNFETIHDLPLFGEAGDLVWPKVPLPYLIWRWFLRPIFLICQWLVSLLYTVVGFCLRLGGHLLEAALTIGLLIALWVFVIHPQLKDPDTPPPSKPAPPPANKLTPHEEVVTPDTPPDREPVPIPETDPHTRRLEAHDVLRKLIGGDPVRALELAKQRFKEGRRLFLESQGDDSATRTLEEAHRTLQEARFALELADRASTEVRTLKRMSTDMVNDCESRLAESKD